ncbi:MAG: hypothetical protein HYV07_22465 [Deltaproteobacteria bacterium]|nr:hypothetical protein [Deltaproteobacteria bacterium]
MSTQLKTAIVLFGLGLSSSALAQNPFDPTSILGAKPNVMVLMDGTRTTLIGQVCGDCHQWTSTKCGAGDVPGGPCGLYRNGLTRLSYIRRALTGGWGWNTSYVSQIDGQVADGSVRTDGVMDVYPVRWGVMWYDGLGVRVAQNMTNDVQAAQKAIIDFGQTPNDTQYGVLNYGYVGAVTLNSYMPNAGTVEVTTYDAAWPNAPNTNPRKRGPYATDLLNTMSCTVVGRPCYPGGGKKAGGGRQARALVGVRDYWKPGVSPAVGVNSTLFSPTAAEAPYFPASNAATDNTVIDGDIGNVLVTAPGMGGCRRNFTLMFTDGHGGSTFDPDGAGPLAAVDNGQVAAQIYNMAGPGGVNLATAFAPNNFANQVFALWFGAEDKANADEIADGGFDGDLTGDQTAFDGAPGGVLDMNAINSSLASIFNTILAGNYLAAPPTITPFGDHLAVTNFDIRTCATFPCNLIRPGHFLWYTLNSDGSVPASANWDAGTILRSRNYTNRKLYSTLPTGNASAASESNCGTWATCGTKTAATAPLGVGALATADTDFLRGNPSATLNNGSKRGDTNADGVVDDPVKLLDVANSRPVIVANPLSIGEDLARWNAFRDLALTRVAAFGGDGSSMKVKNRDQVVYVGSNDGFVHAFLTGKDTGLAPPPGQSVGYGSIGTACTTNAGTTQYDQSFCDGLELWAYSPRFLQPKWPRFRDGHQWGIDGTPAISDVLFTKGTATAGPVCSTRSATCTGWEYRTVMVQCIAGGGRGCFAMDVTNPYDPQLLWEREVPALTTWKMSTSRPTIVRMQKTVGLSKIPYYVAIMGGGFNENSSGALLGNVIAIGVEDGVVYHSVGATGAPGSADFTATPTCLDTDNDLFVDTCYLSASDATIWKVRFADDSPTSMAMVKFFDGRLASGSSVIKAYGKPAGTLDRTGALNLFYATGDFEDLTATSEQNYIFKVRDLYPGAALAAWTAADNAARVNGACTATPADFVGASGGVLPLPAGEKSVFDPTISRGSVLVTSYLPQASTCLSGTSFLYGLRYDSCDLGIDSNNDGAADAARVTVGPGFATMPVPSDVTGRILIPTDDGSINSTFSAPGAGAFPVTKLWWKETVQ